MAPSLRDFKAELEISMPSRVTNYGEKWHSCFFIALPILICFLTGSNLAHCADLKVWFQQPAQNRNETLALGNGRLGALLYGDPTTEHLQLSEDTIWANEPNSKNREGAQENLYRARQLLLAGKYAEAHDLINEKVLYPPGRCYMTLLGDLRLHFQSNSKVTEYRRELDIDRAVATVSYKQDGATFTRIAFISPVDQVLVIHLTCDRPGRISFGTDLSRELYATTSTEGEDMLVMTGSTFPETNGLQYEARLRIIPTGGTLNADNGILNLDGADSATMLLAVASNFRGDEPNKTTKEHIATAGKKEFGELQSNHITEHQRLFRRVTLDLGETSAANLPTDKRVELLKSSGPEDPQLTAMLFQYGRYLLMSSSRPGNMASALHGIWPGRMGDTSYNAAYHVNVNIQMNYWPAEVTNLSECHIPLFDLIDIARPWGRKTAREVYGCDGFVIHHNFDGWGGVGPFGSSPYGLWSGGAGWLCQHVWEHYLYTLDKDFLKTRGYPIMQESARFYLDYLIEHPQTGELVTGPTSSPENSFIEPGGDAKVSFDMGVSMDQEIVWELLTNCLAAATVLEIEDEFTREARASLTKLALPKIGSDGRLLEWHNEYKETDPGHRHFSHLYGMHPGSRITMDGTPELAVAVRNSLEHRLKAGAANKSGAGQIVWSRAWALNFWARLLDGEKAHAELRSFMQSTLEPNLCKKWSTRPYCLDANPGVTAGIAEMLIQSHAGEIQLLPTLPQAWPTGSFKGLRARGAFTVDVSWQGGKLQQSHIVSEKGGPLKVRYGAKVWNFTTQPGQEINLPPHD